MLNSQKEVYDKTDLDYKPNNKQKLLKNFSTSPSTYSTSHITCFSNGRRGHKAFACNSRKTNGKTIKKIWVTKETIVTNPKRSKKTWIPKKTT